MTASARPRSRPRSIASGRSACSRASAPRPARSRRSTSTSCSTRARCSRRVRRSTPTSPSARICVATANDLFKVVTSGKVKIPINQKYPLKDAVKAHRDLEGRDMTDGGSFRSILDVPVNRSRLIPLRTAAMDVFLGEWVQSAAALGPHDRGHRLDRDVVLFHRARLFAQSAERKNPGVYGTAWQVHGGGFYHVEKFTVAPPQLPPHLHWFQWEAYLTWVTGFGLLVVQYYLHASAYLIDPAVMALDAAGRRSRFRSSRCWRAGCIYDVLCRCSATARSCSQSACSR